MAFVMESLGRLQTRSPLQIIRGGAKDSQEDVEKAVDQQTSKLKQAIERYENVERLQVGE